MIGKTLGHYRVGEQLGRGGMGEVYVADDLNLNRKVALKFLPDAFTGDAERMARFEREAKLLASLNHPNIAAIYGLEQAEGKRFLVLELVEGETLAQRLSKGPLPVEEALGIFRQIAEALEAAHEKGVIHRDLKPANVMITAGDKVKILDFGLAKALSDETQNVDSSQSPTLTEAMTRPGVILGTAAYMSPEQAKGKAVDKRADIWAFGCILYECLTGKRAFEGETVTETLAAILKGEPDWQALSAAIPQNIRFVLRRCMEKVVSQRFHCAADLRIEIEEARGIDDAVAPPRRPLLAWGAAALFLLTTLILAVFHFREGQLVPVEPVQLQMVLPDKVTLTPWTSFALSPDGRHLAFAAVDKKGVTRLWIRGLDSLESRPLAGTEYHRIPPFFWSPDSRFLAFSTRKKLKKIDISGGTPQTLCELSNWALGGSWNSDGVIIFGSNNVGEGIMRVSADGGTISPLTKPNPARQETNHVSPTFLPDGRHFLYYCRSRIPENAGVYVGSLDAKVGEQGIKQLMATAWIPGYVPPWNSVPGHLLFLREQTLMAQAFDGKQLKMIGEPIHVADRVGSSSEYGFFSASNNGVLIYRGGTGNQLVQPTWFDRKGKALGTTGKPGMYYGLAISPDGTQAAVGWDSTQPSAITDIWRVDFSRGANWPFTYGKGNSLMPVWSPDGRFIIFSSNRDGAYNLYQKPASGAANEEPVLKSDIPKYANSWSRDGRFLLYTARDPKTNYDLWLLPMESSGKPTPFLRTDFNESDAHFSPDMRWVAYMSDESGNNEVYVCECLQVPGKASLEAGFRLPVSKGGGIGPQWRGDGKELYYLAPDGKVMAVPVSADTVFHAGTPEALFQATLYNSSLSARLNTGPWMASSDGKRFILPAPSTESSPEPFTIILNWTALLKK